MLDINKKLLEKYGKFEYLDIPNYRVVWSTDQFEKRWTKFTREGFELLQKEVKELPKYRQYITDKWILERCLGVPDFVETDLVEKYSYEPLWVFEDKDHKYIEPVWRAVEFIIETVHAQAAQRMGKKYQDPAIVDPRNQVEAERARVDQLKQDLFGNETDLTDALSHREGIVVP